MQYITAYGALIYEGKLTAGDFVLVTAASSSVGIAAIEICKDPRSHQHCHHAHRKKKAELLALGADHVIVTDEEVLPERVKEITDGKVARIVFDPIGGKGLEALAAAAEPSGTIFLYGFYCDWTHAIPAPLFAALMKHLTFPEFLNAKQYVFDHLVKGHFRPISSKTFPLGEIIDAYRYMESNAQIGKIVVTV